MSFVTVRKHARAGHGGPVIDRLYTAMAPPSSKQTWRRTAAESIDQRQLVIHHRNDGTRDFLGIVGRNKAIM